MLRRLRVRVGRLRLRAYKRQSEEKQQQYLPKEEREHVLCYNCPGGL